MDLQQRINDLIGTVYEAAVDPGLMPDLVRGLCDITDSPAGGFVGHDGTAITFEHLVGIDPSFSPRNRELQHQNLYLRRLDLAPPGRAVLGETLAPLSEWQGLELYHEVKLKCGCVHLLGLSIVNEADFLVEISLFRPENAQIHGSRDIDIANLFAGHLERAFRMGRQIGDAAMRAGHLAEALDRLTAGCFLVDTRGRLVFANARAEGLLARDAPLRLSGGRLAAASARDRRAWEMLLHRLARREGPAMGTAVILGEATASPLRLLAVPLSGERVKASGLARPAASNLGLVVISEPQPEPATDQVVIETLFGLTKAEAALAAALASGETLRDYADASRRSLNTVKTHLKSVFSKTGTTRQAELVRLLGATAVVNRRDRD